MQVGKISWVGQTLALARCNDSQGKKSRSRRTKEERRKMVESFIHRYRDSNNGNFPSLNLTHKEVGGSFYTVREIVREIIQANKVLRPGNLKSQAFNLDDCPAQCLPESDFFVPQVINGDSYEEQHCKSQHDSMIMSNEVFSEQLIELSALGENYLPTQDVERSFAEDEDNGGEIIVKCETDDHVAYSQSLSVSSAIGNSVENDMKVDMQMNDLYKIYSVVETENAFNTDYASDKSGNLSSTGHAGGPSPTHAGGLDSSHSTGSTGNGSEQIFVKQVGNLDISGVTETGVSSSKNISHVPVCTDSTLHSMEFLSSTAVDHKAAISTKAQIMDLVNCPTHESTKFQVEPPLFSSGDLHTEVVGGSASGEPGVINSISNSSTVEESNLGEANREKSSEKMEDTESNPLLAIIKGLVGAFIKFWTE